MVRSPLGLVPTCVGGPPFWPVIAMALWAALPGCTSGSVDLVLDTPEVAELAPRDPASVTLVASASGAAPRATTSQIASDGSFDLGELPVGANLDLAVELRDATQRLVGFGRAANPVTISAEDDVEVVVPVRRPFAYVTGAADELFAFDPTLDAGDPAYQARMKVPLIPTLAVAAGGTEVILIGGGGTASRLSTATHQPIEGPPLELPPDIRDAVTSPDGLWLLVAHDEGITLVDLTTREVRDLVVGTPVDRVAIAGTATGGLVAAGLIGRSTGPCAATPPPSRVVTVPLEGGTAVDFGVNVALADIAASPRQATIVGADPCGGRLVTIAGDGALSELVTVSQPTAVAVLGDRAYAVGSVPAALDDDNPTEAAHLLLVAIGVDGQRVTQLDLGPVIESMIATDIEDAVGEDISRNLKARVASAVDLSVVPPGDVVALAHTAEFAEGAIVDGGSGVAIFPEMRATSSQYLLVDLASGSFLQRIRTSCVLRIEPTPRAIFDDWGCRDTPGQDRPDVLFEPRSVAVLYGAR